MCQAILATPAEENWGVGKFLKLKPKIGPAHSARQREGRAEFGSWDLGFSGQRGFSRFSVGRVLFLKPRGGKSSEDQHSYSVRGYAYI